MHKSVQSVTFLVDSIFEIFQISNIIWWTDWNCHPQRCAASMAKNLTEYTSQHVWPSVHELLIFHPFLPTGIRIVRLKTHVSLQVSCSILQICLFSWEPFNLQPTNLTVTPALFRSTENPVISVFNIIKDASCRCCLCLLCTSLASVSQSLPTLSLSYQNPTCLLWWPLRLGQRCRWACCFPACVPTTPQRARWPGAANKLCIQTVDATNGAAQWTNSGDEQLKRCWILLAREEQDLLKLRLGLTCIYLKHRNNSQCGCYCHLISHVYCINNTLMNNVLLR